MSNQPNEQPSAGNENTEHIPAGYYAPPVPPYQAPVPPNAYTDPAAATQQMPAPYGQYPASAPYGQQQAPGSYGQYPAPGPMTYPSGGAYAGAVTAPRGLSLTSMIIGLASLIVGFGFFMVPQIVGIVLGHMGLNKEQPQGKAFAVTGLITNYLALLIFGALYALFFIGIFVSGW